MGEGPRLVHQDPSFSPSWRSWHFQHFFCIKFPVSFSIHHFLEKNPHIFLKNPPDGRHSAETDLKVGLGGDVSDFC